MQIFFISVIGIYLQGESLFPTASRLIPYFSTRQKIKDELESIWKVSKYFLIPLWETYIMKARRLLAVMVWTKAANGTLHNHPHSLLLSDLSFLEVRVPGHALGKSIIFCLWNIMPITICMHEIRALWDGGKSSHLVCAHWKMVNTGCIPDSIATWCCCFSWLALSETLNSADFYLCIQHREDIQ